MPICNSGKCCNFFRPWPIVMCQNRALKKMVKLINCNEICLFVMQENVAIFCRPWLIKMFQKEGWNKKLTNCNEIHLFVMWENI